MHNKTELLEELEIYEDAQECYEEALTYYDKAIERKPNNPYNIEIKLNF